MVGYNYSVTVIYFYHTYIGDIAMCSVCTKYSHGIMCMYVNLTKLYISYTNNYRNLSYLASYLVSHLISTTDYSQYAFCVYQNSMCKYIIEYIHKYISVNMCSI